MKDISEVKFKAKKFDVVSTYTNFASVFGNRFGDFELDVEDLKRNEYVLYL